MQLAIGPYDGRKARRKRCNACVKRKIKCHGGSPCEHCQRTKQPCKSPSRPETFTPVFVSETARSVIQKRKKSPMEVETLHLPIIQVPTSNSYDRSIVYFFVSFLSMNNLSSDRFPVADDLLHLVQEAPALRNAISAVAVQHGIHQKPALAAMNKYKALQSYSESVSYINTLISSDNFAQDPSALWTTFILGLFELIRDSTGTLWLTHFLHGTCAMLQHLTPTSLTQCPQRRRFFLTTRVFEISRSLIYSSPSFLWEAEWRGSIARVWESEDRGLWHPKEALFDLLPCFSELSVRALRFVLHDEGQSIDTTRCLAEEGFALQARLEQWVRETQAWAGVSANDGMYSALGVQQDKELMIAYAYYHAIAIYLSGTFDYHKQWTGPDGPHAPILTPEDIQWHVRRILELSRSLLAHGVAGIFLFFPLRVAGARATDGLMREEILILFRLTSQRGFIVSEALIEDLLDLWSE